MSTEIALELAKFVVETRFPDIPEEVTRFTKGLALKTTAGMVAGSAMPSPKKITKIIKDRKLPDDVGVIGCGFKTSLWEAVLLNAFFAHASELEDDRFNGGVSWDITVIPLLFPLAQHLRLSGKSLMEALAVGLEVHARTCLFPTESLGMVVIPGAVGPAAAAAKALGLDIQRTASALGLAMSGVGVAVPNFGTDAHYFESAMQALQGIMAAEMAKEGMSSNPVIGTYLSTLLGKEKVDQKKIVEDLGKKWKLLEIWVKKYPCCFLTHRHIDTLIELRKQHNLSYDKVKKIEAHIAPSEEICNRPEVKTLGDLQFSFQHILGSAMLDGDVNYDHINGDILASAKLKEARSKVDVIVHSDWSSLYMGSPAVVTVKSQDGKEYSGERKYPIGSPHEPIKQEHFKVLYSKFTKGVLSEEQRDKTADFVLNLEKFSDPEELMDILTYRYKMGRT